MVACIILSFCEVFCDHGAVYCCEVGGFVLFCNCVRVCADFFVCLVLFNVVHLLWRIQEMTMWITHTRAGRITAL